MSVQIFEEILNDLLSLSSNNLLFCAKAKTMFVHSSRIQRQIEYLKSLKVNTDPVFELAQIDPNDILNHEKTFSFEQYHILLDFAIKQTGDKFYGLKMGQEPHIAGTIGMMCASCKNLKEAFIQGCKYFKIQGNFANIAFIDDDKFPRIEFSITNAWKMRHPDTARHEIEAMFSFLITISKINSNNRILPSKVMLSYSPPDIPDIYKNHWGLLPLFDQDVDAIVFNSHDLMIPMKAFNPETYTILKSHIESQLKILDQKESCAEKVKSILLSSFQYQFPDIETVAEKLNLSSRTLQRQLSMENTNFKTILQQTRFDIAKHFLKDKTWSVSEISYALGYSDLGNFSRSFKKHTGQSPQDYRADL